MDKNDLVDMLLIFYLFDLLSFVRIYCTSFIRSSQQFGPTFHRNDNYDMYDIYNIYVIDHKNGKNKTPPLISYL